MAFIDFNDNSISLGKRKVAYVSFLMKKGKTLIAAQKAANKKFGFEVKPKTLVLLIYNPYMVTRTLCGGKNTFSWCDYTKKDVNKYQSFKVQDITDEFKAYKAAYKDKLEKSPNYIYELLESYKKEIEGKSDLEKMEFDIVFVIE